MRSRRTALGLLATWFLGSRAKAQPAARGPVKELARHPLTGPQAGMEAILVEVTLLPGVPSRTHRHPGFVLGYVLEGEMSFAFDGQVRKGVKAGETFFEPFGVLHTTGESANPEAPAKFLAFIVAPKGSPVTIPA
jgi:quercetin dioxygenase-like cupin family protein